MVSCTLRMLSIFEKKKYVEKVIVVMHTLSLLSNDTKEGAVYQIASKSPAIFHGLFRVKATGAFKRHATGDRLLPLTEP